MGRPVLMATALWAALAALWLGALAAFAAAIVGMVEVWHG